MSGLFSFLATMSKSPYTYLSLCFIILIIVFIAFIYKRNLAITVLGKTVLGVDSKLSKKDDTFYKRIKNIESGKSPHSGCPHINDFILVISETTNVVSEISEIKYKGCMSEQMFRSDQHLLILRSLMQKRYRKALLSKTNQKNLQFGENLKSYKFYQSLTRSMIQDVKDLIIRVAFLNNHLADFDDKMDYENYVKRQTDSVINSINDTTIDIYVGDWALSQNEVMSMHHDMHDDIKKTVNDIFMDARDIAIRSKKQIEEMEISLKKFVTKIVGTDGQID